MSYMTPATFQNEVAKDEPKDVKKVIAKAVKEQVVSTDSVTIKKQKEGLFSKLLKKVMRK